MKKYILAIGLCCCLVGVQGQTMIEVKAGSFTMGNASYPREAPARSVSVSRFYISDKTITNAQFAEFLNAYGSQTVKDGEYAGKLLVKEDSWGVLNDNGTWKVAPGYEQFPAVKVTWYGANEYCKVAGGRLPTETEWEYAAKGGPNNNTYIYSGSSTATSVAWYYDNSTQINHAVGTKTANSLGLYDMSGNVYQWCSDWFGRYADFGASGDTDPKGPAAGVSKVIRGGYRSLGSADLHLTNRESLSPDECYNFVGFRLVKDEPNAVTTITDDFVRLYPNPASEFISITASEEISNVEVIDCKGQRVYYSKENIRTIPVGGLSNGIYMVKLTTTTDKISIQKIAVKN